MSLRSRLLAGLAVVAVVLVVACVVVTRTTESNLVDQVDARLARLPGPGVVQSFGSVPGGATGAGPTQPADELTVAPQAATPEGEVPDSFSEVFIGEVAGDGSVQAFVDPALSGDDVSLPSFEDIDVAGRVGDPEPFTVSGDGTRFRVVAAGVTSTGGTVVVALPLTDVDATIERLILLEAGVVLTLLAVLGIVAWWVLHLGVRPIKQMTATASAIADGDLSQRVPEGSPGTEAAELGDALNRMMANIEAAFDERTRADEQVRRFVADASHELRTPVATVRGYAELYRSGGLEQDEELDEAMRRTEQEAIRMGRLVDDLLALARLDQGRPLEQERVDVGELVADAASDARAREPDRPVEATVADEPLTVGGDEHRLRQVLANLVANALVHTDEGTPVEVVAEHEADGEVVVRVVDHGDGMSPTVAAHAFERFYRGDPSRTRHKGGSGLGLAIVESVVTAHRGSVALSETPGGGTTATVRLPASPGGDVGYAGPFGGRSPSR
jgi:two-component system OmpR family sensor kinase